MTSSFRTLCLICSLALSFVAAQADDLRFEDGVLQYDLSYARAQAIAQALECPQDVLENGLIHSSLRHIFLFLPLEATYHEGVEVLEVRVMSDVGPVLSLRAPLDGIRATNSPFRVFMNSFASPKAGFCFAVDEPTLELWLETFLARGGQLAYDENFLVSDLGRFAATAAASAPSVQEESEADPGVASEPALAPEAATTGSSQPVPYLSDVPVRVFSGASEVLEPDTDYFAMLETSEGTLYLDLFEGLAPRTVNNFVFLARNRFYENVPFHRVIDDFMAQTGDPTGSGLGGPGYRFADEIVAGLSHSAPGVVSMANAGPDTNGSQFFITFAPAQHLDGQYSIFGVVTEGLAVLDALQRTDPSAPLAVATLDSSLGLLALQGIDLDGNADVRLDTYLLDTLGAVPDLSQRVALGAYDIVLGIEPQTGAEVLGFWPLSDRVLNVQIFSRPK